MSICGNRPADDKYQSCRPCKCGEQVAAELEQDAQRDGPIRRIRPNDNGGAG